MSVAPLQQRALEDQLRRMQLQIDALERRMATGDSISFDADPTPGHNYPPYVMSAEYVRTNQLLVCWYTMAFTGGPPGVDTAPITFATPYPFDHVLGQWSVFWSSTNSIKQYGPVTDYLGATDRIWLHESLIGQNVGGSLDVTRMGRNDLTLGGTVYNNWKNGDVINVVINARIPAGS